MITGSGWKLRSISLCVLVVLFSVLLPFVLNLSVLSSFVDATRKISKMQEFFGLSGFLAIAFMVIWTIKENRPSDLYGYMEILAPAVVALVWLSVITERTLKDYDYVCYEGAAQFLLGGKNPYQAECYYYPPLLILIFSWAYNTIQYGVTVLRGSPLEYDKAWAWVFYLYQCMQWFMVILAYFLSRRLAEKYGLQKIVALGAVTLLFVLNNPLLRTLHFFQINLWILNIVMLVLLYSVSHPFVTGLLAALGAHIKLYPVLFIAPWSLLKERRALSGFAAGVTALFLLIFGAFGNLTIWLQFMANDPTHAGGYALRDNSFHSLIYHLLRISGFIQEGDLNGQIPELVTSCVVLAVVGWFLVRVILRYRALTQGRGLYASYSFERDGLLVDMVGLMLLASPVVWEHHYVLAMPVLLWTFALQIRQRQLPVASLLAYSLIFGLPTFDVFPLSYLRLAGLFILLVKSDPFQQFRTNVELQQAKTPTF